MPRQDGPLPDWYAESWLPLREALELVRSATRAERSFDINAEAEALRNLARHEALAQYPTPAFWSDRARGQHLAGVIRDTFRRLRRDLGKKVNRSDYAGVAVLLWHLTVCEGMDRAAILEQVDQHLEGDGPTVGLNVYKERTGIGGRPTRRALSGIGTLHGSLRLALAEASKQTDYDDDVVATVRYVLSFYLASDQAAVQLLDLLAFAQPEEPFPLGLLRARWMDLPAQLGDAIRSESATNALIGRLAERTLITRTGDGVTITAAVQAAIASTWSNDQRERLTQEYLDLLSEALDENSHDSRTYREWHEMAAHVAHLGDLPPMTERAPATVGWLLDRAAVHIRQFGHEARAVEIGTQAVKLLTVAYGRVHPKVAIALGNNALALRLLERYQEADAAIEEALSIERETIGETAEHAGSLNIKAAILHYLDRHAEAEQVHQEAIRIAEANADTAPLILVEILNDYGSQLLDMGEWRRAETALERAHTIADDEHLLGFVKYNYGHAVAELNRYEEGYQLLRESLDIRRRLYPTPSVQVADTIDMAAQIALAAGRKETAEALFVEARDMYETLRSEETYGMQTRHDPR